jgi:hypothetical protein
MTEQQYNHYRSMDIYGNGVGYNVVIVKEDANGDVYFIKEEDLDGVDIRRMKDILSRREAARTPLWDVMSQVTLKNGMNALEYFHQLVLVRTSSGQIIHPSDTRRGMRQTLNVPQRPAARPPAQRQAQPQAEAKQAVTESSGDSKPKKRGPGRPRKKKSS